jgi:hypothetical protein
VGRTLLQTQLCIMLRNLMPRHVLNSKLAQGSKVYLSLVLLNAWLFARTCNNILVHQFSLFQVPPEVEHAGLDASVHGSKHGNNGGGGGFVDLTVEPTMVKPKSGGDDNA